LISAARQVRDFALGRIEACPVGAGIQSAPFLTRINGFGAPTLFPADILP
jgi:hypothetical protein